MKDLNLAIHLNDNIIQISESYFDGKVFHVNKLVESEDVYPIFSNQSEKLLLDEAKLIEKFINQANFNLKNVRIVIPDDVTFFQIIDLPLLSEKELISAVKYQAEQIIPLPIKEVAVDLSIIEENKKEKKAKILLVAAPLNLINSLTRLIEEAGLIPEVIENEISALSRLIAEIYPIKSNMFSIFFNLGYNSSSLYFYHPQKNLIIETYTFNLGSSLFFKELKINFNLDNKKVTQILKEKGIVDDNQIKTQPVLLPVINEIVKNLTTFISLIKNKYALSEINQIFFINQASLIKNLDKEIAKQINCQCLPLILPTQPNIPNPQNLIFNFAQYQKK